MLTARMCQRRLGFAVQVAPSGLEHPKAGNGLWLSGQAEPGAVVALYPGIVYPPLHYKCLPATASPWHVSRLQACVADSRPPSLLPVSGAVAMLIHSGVLLHQDLYRACDASSRVHCPCSCAFPGPLRQLSLLGMTRTPARLRRHMPGYPRVDKGNDTLLARYDGSVVDALPWQQLAAPADGDLQVPGSKLPPWRRMLEVRQPPLSPTLP